METDDSEKAPCCLSLRACTLRITFVIVIGTGLAVSALVVCFDVYGQKVFKRSQGDTAIHQISSSYCQGVKISVANSHSKFNAYVMPRKPQLSSKRVFYRNGMQFYMPSWSYQYWGVYFLKGSLADIFICADQYIMFYIIKGEKSFHEWKQTTLYRGYKQKHRLFPKENCKNKSQYDHFRIHAKEDDSFYIMFSSSVGWRFYTQVSLLLEMKRSVYNTSSAIHSCSSQNVNDTCHLPLRYNSDDTVLIEYIQETGAVPDLFKASKVKWMPEPRLLYYAALFGGIFLCVACLTLIYSVSRCIAKSYPKPDKYPPLRKSISYSNQEKKKFSLPRRPTRTTLASYEVIDQNEVMENTEAFEASLTQMNEEFDATTTYLSREDVRDLNMTAAGISAI